MAPDSTDINCSAVLMSQWCHCALAYSSLSRWRHCCRPPLSNAIFFGECANLCDHSRNQAVTVYWQLPWHSLRHYFLCAVYVHINGPRILLTSSQISGKIRHARFSDKTSNCWIMLLMSFVLRWIKLSQNELHEITCPVVCVYIGWVISALFDGQLLCVVMHLRCWNMADKMWYKRTTQQREMFSRIQVFL